MFSRVIACVACIALVAACDDDSDPGAEETVPQATVPPTTVRASDEDGILRIGLLLPKSGEAAATGQPLIDAARVATDAVNAAGGVLERPIELVTDFDEGDDAESARDAIAGLIDADVDAVIGPASSTIALAVLDDLLSAGILTCSPTATALALDDLPDSESMFIRTAPSDSLQAVELAQLAEDTGARSVAVTYVDDPYGRQLGGATITALRSRGLEVLLDLPFSSEDDSLLVDEATAITSSDADVVIVLGDGEHGARMLSELGEATGITPGERPPTILVNDAIRRPPSPQLIQELAEEVRQRITGVSPLAYGTAEGEPPGAFATNAYDCVNLIALAAVAANSDNGTDMRAEIVDISDGGVPCRTFAACTEQVGLQIDYDGPGGLLQLGADGDPSVARFDRFGFDENGFDVSKPSPSPGPPIVGS